MPKWFSRGRWTYPEIKKLSKEEIYARRVERLVGDHERDAQRIARLKLDLNRNRNQRSRENLSREVREYLSKLYDAESQRQKARSDTSRAAMRSAFLTRLSRERLQRTKLSEEGWKKAKAAAADRRVFHPARHDLDFVASTKFGTVADTVIAKAYYPKMWAKDLPRYLNPTIAIPCIQRNARREVMFAKKFARKGYKVPHRRNANSGVPC